MPMKVLFVVHRMHTNLREVKRAIELRGGRCLFVVSRVGPSEPSSLDARILVDPRSLYWGEAEEIMQKFQPDLLVQRDFQGRLSIFWELATNMGLMKVRYTQDPHQIPYRDFIFRPLRVMRFTRDWLYYRIRLGRHRIVTPVEYWGKPTALVVPGAHHVAPPMRMQENHHPSHRNTLRVLCVAKHGQRRKRVHWLVKALSQADKPFSLIVVGSAPEANEFKKIRGAERLEKSISALGPRSKFVSLHTDLDEASLRKLYSEADIFVLPAKREMMAISPLEAMAHGLPVLVSSDGGAACYVTPVGKEQIFRSRSYQSFRKRLSLLLEDRRLRDRLSIAASIAVTRNHSPRQFHRILANEISESTAS